MATIFTRIESSRGCGYRKPGGFYLVIDGKGIECGFLPVDLPHEIKTSRAPQWKESQKVMGVEEKRICQFTQQKDCKKKCHNCWLKQTPNEQIMLLIFVGMAFYKTTKQFEKEAGRLGISRRIPPHIIPRIEIGKTTVILAHRQSSHRITPDGEVEKVRQIFTAFKPQRIEYIITGKETEQELDEMEKQGITLIEVQKAGKVLDLGFKSN